VIGPLQRIEAPTFATVQAAQNVIYDANLLLNESEYGDWLTLCDADFTYRITAYSPEIRKLMAWLDHDRAGILNLVELLPRHQSDHSRITRHTTVYRIDTEEPSAAADAKADTIVHAVSSVAIYRTLLDGGTTTLFAIGNYHDRIRIYASAARFAARELRLETRQLGIGTHFPL
jgi:methanesulfonate monooxygenase subunit beta